MSAAWDTFADAPLSPRERSLARVVKEPPSSGRKKQSDDEGELLAELYRAMGNALAGYKRPYYGKRKKAS